MLIWSDSYVYDFIVDVSNLDCKPESIHRYVMSLCCRNSKDTRKFLFWHDRPNKKIIIRPQNEDLFLFLLNQDFELIKTKIPEKDQEIIFLFIGCPVVGVKNGKKKMIIDSTKKIEWLSSRLGKFGLGLIDSCINIFEEEHINVDGKNTVINHTIFGGKLKITDKKDFSTLLRIGTGKFKSYGYGFFKILKEIER